MNTDILAIGAHPDDIELGCGGTIASCVKQGLNVSILDLTLGELGTRGNAKIRTEEAKNASKILGVKSRINLKLPDGNIEVNKKNIYKVISIIRSLRPKILIIPHFLERHPDHEHTHTIAKEAWFYSGLEKIKTSLNGKDQIAYRPKKYFHFMQKYEFEPSFIFDISDVFDIKMKAIKAFASQFYNPNSKEKETLLSNKEFLEFIEARDRNFGSMIYTKYGEAFYSFENVKINNILNLI